MHDMQHLLHSVQQTRRGMMTSTHQSLRRAVSILRVFTENEPEIGVGEIGRRLGLHKSTVSRILAALLDEGLVWHNPQTGRYSLGMGLVELAGVALGQIDVRAVALPHMEALARELDETVTASVLRGEEAVTVAHIPSTQSIRHVVWIGRRTPLAVTASGKVFLAARYRAGGEVDPGITAAGPGEEVVSAEGPAPPDMAAVWERGYSVEIDEFESGTSAVAAPIHDATGAVIAAISVGAPTFRFGTESIARAGPAVAAAASAVTEGLVLRDTIVAGGERR